MTYKELGYLREHRRSMLSNTKVAQADAVQSMTEM